MKRIRFAVGLVILVFMGALQAQTATPKPGPEQKKLNIWVGDWTYESENQATPLGPAEKFRGMATARLVLGGFFVEWRGEATRPAGTSHSLWIDGYDAVNKKFKFNSFDSDGNFETGVYTIEGNTQNISGTSFLGEKQYRFRGSIVFAPDLMSFVEKREVSIDGQTWMPQFEAKWTKTKS